MHKIDKEYGYYPRKGILVPCPDCRGQGGQRDYYGEYSECWTCKDFMRVTTKHARRLRRQRRLDDYYDWRSFIGKPELIWYRHTSAKAKRRGHVGDHAQFSTWPEDV